MTNKFLLNRSGMSPEVTCRKGRHAIESIVSRFSLASLICVLMLTIGVGQMWGSSPASTTMQSVVTANSYEVSVDNTIGTKCLSIDLDDNINISINSGGNNGTFWGTGASINWRGYQAQSGTYTLTAKNGCTLSSVTFTFTVDKGGTLNTNGTDNNIAAAYRLTSGTALSLSGTSKTLYVGNTNSTGSNLGKGQVRITAISVSYSSPAPACADPVAPSNSSYTSSSLTLATTSTSANYDFYCSTTNSTSGATALTIQSVTGGQSKEYTGLNYGTTYYYWIRKNCGGGSTSSWVAGASTATTAAPNTGLSISAGSLKPTKATFTIGDSNSPKINTYGGTYDIYYSTSDDTPTGSTVASRNESTLSWTATGLTAGTKYYYWVRGHGANANSSWVSGGNFTTPTLSSITVKTEPTTTTYFAGQTFNPAGLEITLHYSNSSTDDVAYSGNEGSFSFDPTTSTALTTSDAAVTITYGGQSVNQSINVYSVTVNKVKDTGGEIDAATVTATWTVGTKTLTAAVGATQYRFKEWAFVGSNNGLTITDTGNATTTVTGTPTGNVTINGVFYAPRNIVWMVNGETYSAGGSARVPYNTEWSALTLPTNPDPGDYCGDKFMGWTTTNIGSVGQATDAGLDLMTSVNKSGKTGSGHQIQDATVTFYAVFADYGE